MRARLTTVAVPIATATLALGTAAWAANGRLPLLPESDVRALAVTAQASGPLVANDQEGSAILRAEALAPGDTTTGEVTIRNAGDAAGAFSLSPSGATDSGAPPEGPLSGVLRLSVSDVTDGTPAPVYDGTLAAFARVGLGTFPAGAAHRYRFALTYPSGTPVDDNGYQGASASVAFDWDAVAVGSGSSTRAPTPATPTPTPGPTAEATGSGSAPSTTATRGTTTPATSAAAAAAIPAGTATGRFKVSVGRVKERPVRGRRLYLWVQSTRASRTRVTATVSWRGHRAMTLRAQTVKAGAKRRTVRLRLPAAAVRGARHSLTMRVRAAATSGAGRASAKRTLRVRSR
jgi:hypothetical protein